MKSRESGVDILWDKKIDAIMASMFYEDQTEMRIHKVQGKIFGSHENSLEECGIRQTTRV